MTPILRLTCAAPATLLILAAAASAPAARADVVTDWNERAMAAMIAEGPAVATSGTGTSRTLAMVHIAMAEAVNATGRKFKPYLSSVPAAAGASAEAAAHAAARGVLVELLPKQKAAVEGAYLSAIGKVADGPAKSAGIAAGESAAQTIVAQRKSDGAFGSPDTYRPQIGRAHV